MGLTTHIPCVVIYGNNRISGHRPFVEGFMEDFTDPLHYIFIGWVSYFMIIVYLLKKRRKNKVDEDEEVNKSVQEENSSNGSVSSL